MAQMTINQALKIIDKAIFDYRKRLAFGANMYDFGCREPFAIRDYNSREQLEKALGVLENDYAAQQLKLGFEND